jgi:vacuolar-type H+-ATPase subunit H
MIKEPTGERKSEAEEIINTPEQEKSELLKRLEKVVKVVSPNVCGRLMRVFIPKVEAFDKEGNLGQQWLDGMRGDFYDDKLLKEYYPGWTTREIEELYLALYDEHMHPPTEEEKEATKKAVQIFKEMMKK